MVVSESVARRPLVAPSTSRLAAVVIDQGVVSLASLVLLLAGGRIGGLRDLGIVGLVQTVGLVVIGFTRMVVFQPMLVDRDRTAERAALTCVTLIIAACAVGVVGLLLARAPAVWALAASITAGQLLQEYWRTALFARGQTWRTVVLDAPLLACVLVGLAVCTTIDALLAFWVAGILMAAAVGLALCRVVPARVRDSARWLSGAPKELGVPLLVDGILYLVVVQGSVIWLGAAVGLDQVGALRLSALVLGPLAVLAASLTNWSLPAMPSSGPIPRRISRAVAALAAAAVLLVLAAVAATAAVVGHLGTSVETPGDLALTLALVGASYTGVIAAIAYQAALKARRTYWPMVAWRTATSAVMVVLLVGGASRVAGSAGVAGLWAAQSWVLLLAAAVTYGRSRRREGAR